MALIVNKAAKGPGMLAFWRLEAIWPSPPLITAWV